MFANESRIAGARLAALLLVVAPTALAAQTIDPARFPRVGQVSPRFQSYNVEMTEVTGGRFWKPYRLGAPVDEADRYRVRTPIDFVSPKLRMLARALGPAYLRVSGTWANTTYFAGDAAVSQPPSGFSAVLTGRQWRGVLAFSRAVDAPIVTSVAGSAGARDAAGAWAPDQLQALLAYTHAHGWRIAAAEFLNEPNLVSLTGVPGAYDARGYGRDWDRFATALHDAEPGALRLGPGSIGEGGKLKALGAATKIRLMSSTDMLAASTIRPDVITFHHYPAVSERCGKGTPLSTTADQAMSPALFDRSLQTLTFYASLRDRFAPGAPIWLTETGQAVCGGDRWSSTFADTPRYVDQLGLLARHGVQVVMHNTLAASDYALLDETTLDPRPNYWAALLWRRLMGETVLDAPAVGSLRLYAHCLSGRPGGVALAAINTGSPTTMRIGSQPARAYSLTAAGAAGAALNGRTLALQGDRLPNLEGAPVIGGELAMPAASVTFVALPAAKNPTCTVR